MLMVSAFYWYPNNALFLPFEEIFWYVPKWSHRQPSCLNHNLSLFTRTCVTNTWLSISVMLLSSVCSDTFVPNLLLHHAVRSCLPACLCSQSFPASVTVRSCLLVLALTVVSMVRPPVVSCHLLVTVVFMVILPIVSVTSVTKKHLILDVVSGHWTTVKTGV